MQTIGKRLAARVVEAITGMAKQNPLALASIIGVMALIAVVAVAPTQFQNLVAKLPYHTITAFTGQGDNHTSTVAAYGDQNRLEVTCADTAGTDMANAMTITEQTDRNRVLLGNVSCDGQQHEVTFAAYGSISFVISALPAEHWRIVVRGEA